MLIPCQRCVKDHVEREVNHFARGKTHTSPDAEDDIRNLEAAYKKDELHTFKPGRKLVEKDRVKDFMSLGVEGTRLKNTISRWVENRLSKVATTENFEPYKFE
jgi:hypothetical protein